MKKILIFFMCSFLCFSLLAEHVSFEEAQIIAKNWTEHLINDFNDHVTPISGETIVREGIEVAHVFHFFPLGYVIISAEDYLPPIKMYSLKNNFGKEGKKLEGLVFDRYLEIINKVNIGAIDPGKVFMAKNKRDFQLLKGVPFPFRTANSTGDGIESEAVEVQPLLTTTWSQREPYNLMCPEVDGERSVTGCVTTAFAQILKYHEYPPSGQGSMSYWTDTHNLYISNSFDHPYYWDRMLDSYPTPDSGTPEQRQAVAQLMLDVGVTFEVDYSPDGSGGSCAPAVWNFPYFFRYSRDITFVSRKGWNDGEWFELAKDQVDHGLPVGFGIYTEEVGHMVVVDGYRISNVSSTLHINMGWGGSWDGYYALDNIIVGDGKYEFTVPDYQCFVLNIVPPDSGIDLPSPPFGATAHENRSLFFREYFCQLTWKGLPIGEENPDRIDKYVIHRYDGNSGEGSVIAEIDHTGEIEYRYTFRMSDYSPDLFIVYAVRESGAQKNLLICNLVLKQ
jgi:hypothetical protein